MAPRKKILAVDDDASMRKLYEEGLSPLGYDVSTVAGAAEAKTYLASNKPDLILMDILMPDQDGISLTREIRSAPETSGIPVLIVSGLDDAATLGDALLFGAADYVVKPVDMSELKMKIEHTFSLADRRKKRQPA